MGLPEDCSEDIFPAFPGTKVHGIHFEHEARPSVAINLITGLNDYLKTAQGLPKTVQELQAEVVRIERARERRPIIPPRNGTNPPRSVDGMSGFFRCPCRQGSRLS